MKLTTEFQILYLAGPQLSLSEKNFKGEEWKTEAEFFFDSYIIILPPPLFYLNMSIILVSFFFSCSYQHLFLYWGSEGGKKSNTFHTCTDTTVGVTRFKITQTRRKSKGKTFTDQQI